MAGLILDGYPTWNQNRDPKPDGSQDPFATTDCGEECCAILLYALKGEYLTETQVREAMPGHSDHGETTPLDLVTFLKTRFRDGSSFTLGKSTFKSYLKSLIRNGAPAISLGYYISPSRLHWVVVVGFGNDHVVCIDPWYGRMVAWHWSQFLAASVGTVVVAATE